MRFTKHLAGALTSLVLPTCIPADALSLREHVEFLASPYLEGRLTGTTGERIAAEYLSAQLRAKGLMPLQGHESYLMPFDFVGGMSDSGSTLSLLARTSNQMFAGEAVNALSFSNNGSVTAPVVFAGYGIKTPDSSETPYDSYHGLNLEGKIAVILRYFPEDTTGDFRRELSRYSGLRFKALHAREAGAAGLIVVTGPNSPNAGKTVPMGFDTSVAGSGIVAVSADASFGESLFAGHEKSLQQIQDELDDGNPHVSGFELPGKKATISVEIEREKRIGNNVVAMLPATDGVSDEYVIVGAHYDHLGYGAGGNSLAGQDEGKAVHPGADDNASGVAVILEMIDSLAGRERDRHLVLGFWSGEELGLIGAQAFADEEVVPSENVAAYLNLDMVGYVADNSLTIQGVGSSNEWPSMIERANIRPGFDLTLANDPYLPTDAMVFYQNDVPILSFFTGAHEHYHKPSDTPEKLNYKGMDRVASLVAAITGNLLNAETPPVHVAVERSTQEGSGRSMGRVYTGTIPDYTAEVEGLMLSGVMKDGPAERAGLQEDDIIVEFAGQTVANIYDYMYALESVKIDEPVPVVILRAGERIEREIVPTVRK